LLREFTNEYIKAAEALKRPYLIDLFKKGALANPDMLTGYVQMGSPTKFDIDSAKEVFDAVMEEVPSESEIFDAKKGWLYDFVKSKYLYLSGNADRTLPEAIYNSKRTLDNPMGLMSDIADEAGEIPVIEEDPGIQVNATPEQLLNPVTLRMVIAFFYVCRRKLGI
jgi:hypothetical protein